MSKIDPTLSIPAFYAGKSILITGATGFMGKILVEKLLRSCPEIREIFLLLRPKKGMNIDDRLRQLLKLPIFDLLREEKPSAFDKLIPVSGNTAEEGLGLPDVERRVIIERVNVFFHVAASVRFDDSLKDAVFLNTRSTRDACILAAQMKKLSVFMHVSTTYSQADKPVVEEKLYPAHFDWKKTIKIAETVDEHILKTLTPKFLGNFPNTYTFTKRLAEQVVHDYSHAIPAVVMRPSIVISTLKEPLAGWIDNFNGPVGMMVGGGKGVVRVIYGDSNLSADFIPVDVAIKAMIIASWKRGIKTITKDPTVHVYNCSSADIKSLSVEEVKNMGMRWNDRIPLENILWRPATVHTAKKSVYFLLALFTHIIPALIIDSILKLSGKKPLLFRLQKKIYVANNALAYFLLNEWKFKNENLIGLLTDVPTSDIESFQFEYASFDANLYFKNCLVAAKKYLLKEDMNNLEGARVHFKRMLWIDRIFKGLLSLFALWFFYYFGIFSSIVGSIEQLINETY